MTMMIKKPTTFTIYQTGMGVFVKMETDPAKPIYHECVQ